MNNNNGISANEVRRLMRDAIPTTPRGIGMADALVYALSQSYDDSADSIAYGALAAILGRMDIGDDDLTDEQLLRLAERMVERVARRERHAFSAMTLEVALATVE